MECPEHKIGAWLDIDQVMIDIQSWRESLTSDVETSRGILERGPYSYLCGHRRAKGSKSVEVLHFYYPLTVDMREMKLRGPCQIFYEHNKIKMARQVVKV